MVFGFASAITFLSVTYRSVNYRVDCKCTVAKVMFPFTFCVCRYEACMHFLTSK